MRRKTDRPKDGEEDDMKRNMFVVVVIAIFAIMTMGCQNQTPNIRSDNAFDEKISTASKKITVGDVVFNEHFSDSTKPENGFFATKWYFGEPQIMCYNGATRDDIPAALLMAMLDWLNARQPIIRDDMNNDNFNRHEWSLTDYGSAPKVNTPAPAKEIKSTLAPALKETSSTDRSVAAVEPASVKQSTSLKKRVVILEKKNLYEDVEARIKILGFNSIVEFQIAEGLKADGIPGSKTLWMLRRAEALPRIKALGYETFYEFQNIWGIKKDNLWGNQSEATLMKAEEINEKYSATLKARLDKDVKAFQCQYNLVQRGSVDPATKSQADKTLRLPDQQRSEELISTAPVPDCTK